MGLIRKLVSQKQVIKSLLMSGESVLTVDSDSRCLRRQFRATCRNLWFSHSIKSAAFYSDRSLETQISKHFEKISFENVGLSYLPRSVFKSPFFKYFFPKIFYPRRFTQLVFEIQDLRLSDLRSEFLFSLGGPTIFPSSSQGLGVCQNVSWFVNINKEKLSSLSCPRLLSK